MVACQLFNHETSVLTQKCDPCTEDLNSATFGDSKNAILGDVQGKASLTTVPLACL